jgi:glycosyltransferase involved in cell wall biosynthesis
MKKKIAVIGLKGLPAFGGAAAVGENIIEQLKDKYEFTVYSVNSHTELKTGEYNGYKQIVQNRFLSGNKNTFLYYIKSAIRVLFSNFDIVHIHHASATFIIPVLRLRNKVIVTTHGVHIVTSDPKWEKSKWYFDIQNKLVKSANILTCVSKREINWIKENMGVNPIHIPNGISFDYNVEGFPKEDIVFFAAGRITEAKGCHILLEALKKLNYKGRIEIAGDLSHDMTYTGLIKQKAEGLNVHFIGLIKSKVQLLEKVAKAKLFVFPSLREAMSMMLLEAASVRASIISSDIAENRDVFNEQELLFFKNKSAIDLAEKISWALGHSNAMEEKAQLAYNKLKKNHDWSEIAQSYSDIYEKLL